MLVLRGGRLVSIDDRTAGRYRTCESVRVGRTDFAENGNKQVLLVTVPERTTWNWFS